MFDLVLGFRCVTTELNNVREMVQIDNHVRLIDAGVMFPLWLDLVVAMDTCS